MHLLTTRKLMDLVMAHAIFLVMAVKAIETTKIVVVVAMRQDEAMTAMALGAIVMVYIFCKRRFWWRRNGGGCMAAWKVKMKRKSTNQTHILLQANQAWKDPKIRFYVTNLPETVTEEKTCRSFWFNWHRQLNRETDKPKSTFFSSFFGIDRLIET